MLAESACVKQLVVMVDGRNRESPDVGTSLRVARDCVERSSFSSAESQKSWTLEKCDSAKAFFSFDPHTLSSSTNPSHHLQHLQRLPQSFRSLEHDGLPSGKNSSVAQRSKLMEKRCCQQTVFHFLITCFSVLVVQLVLWQDQRCFYERCQCIFHADISTSIRPQIGINRTLFSHNIALTVFQSNTSTSSSSIIEPHRNTRKARKGSADAGQDASTRPGAALQTARSRGRLGGCVDRQWQVRGRLGTRDQEKHVQAHLKNGDSFCELWTLRHTQRHRANICEKDTQSSLADCKIQ